jgi:nitrite reductase/ring-hydroxylating ferredoxin subunit
MADDERRDAAPEPERDLPAAERFDRYLESLLGEGRPSPDSVGDRDEAEMARMAAELAASGRATGAAPDPAFVEQLRLRMRRADEAIDAVRTPPPVRGSAPPPTTGRWRLTRRDLLRGGIGAAAGLAAGTLGLSLLRDGDAAPDSGSRDIPLVGGEGFWAEVATLADVPPGTAFRFSTMAFDGFIVNDAGEIRALSSVCTHMQCTLQFRPDWQDLRCPCHGASFDLAGRLANSRSRWRSEGAYAGDARAYPIDLPDLVKPRVKVEDEVIYVWTAQA